MMYPKILIVTSLDIFADNSSSSLTVRSFFEGIPQSNIYQLICCAPNSEFRGRFGNNYYLSEKDIILYPSFRRNSKRTSNIIQPIDEKISNNGFDIRYQLTILLKDILSFLPFRLDNNLLTFLKEEGIEFIYTCSFTPRCYQLIGKISRHLKIQHVCHFLDDWPNIQFVDSCFSKLFRLFFNRNLRKFIHESPFCLCISELMCDCYKSRYNYQNFYPLMHSVNAINVRCNNSAHKNKKCIIYAGSLYLERYVSIKEFCSCIRRLGLQDEYEVVLFTHGSHWNELSSIFSEFNFVRYGGFISHDKLMVEIQNSYALLFVESLKEELLEYTRLSMSTKIPEFLSSGKPIFAIGNSNQGSIYYLKNHDAAFVVDDLSDIDRKFLEFSNSEHITRIVSNANSLFLENHQKDNQKKFFLSLIINSLK